MQHISSRKQQRGYLLEIPLLLAVIGIVLAVLLPNLPPIGQKILLVIAVLPTLFGLYYMIVTPGWMPDTSGRLRPPWSLLVFLLVAAAILTVLGLFIFGGT